MAMLRSSRARGLTGLAMALCLATVPCVGKARAADPSAAERGTLQVPRWVESLGDGAAKPKARASRSAEAPAAAAPLPQAPAASATPLRAAPLTISRTPSADGRGKPGRQLLRSRGTADVDDRAARLVSGWGELGDASTVRQASATEEESTDENARGADLGPERSVLHTADSPAADAPARPAAEPAAAPARLPLLPLSLIHI